MFKTSACSTAEKRLSIQRISRKRPNKCRGVAIVAIADYCAGRRGTRPSLNIIVHQSRFTVARIVVRDIFGDFFGIDICNIDALLDRPRRLYRYGKLRFLRLLWTEVDEEGRVVPEGRSDTAHGRKTDR
jgi:hypothetical protein